MASYRQNKREVMDGYFHLSLLDYPPDFSTTLKKKRDKSL